MLIGETLSKITNGYYPATNHRVFRPPPGVHRIAMPFLMRGRPEAVINTKAAKRIKAKRPGVLSKFQTVTIRQLPNVDAAKVRTDPLPSGTPTHPNSRSSAKVLVRMVLQDQLAQYKEKKAKGEEWRPPTTAEEKQAKRGEDATPQPPPVSADLQPGQNDMPYGI